MILILAILAATRASPSGQLSPSSLSLDQLQPPGSSCDDLNGCRSLGDIIRSSIVTILLCTWASMHPNIPSPDERWPRIAIRRAGLFLLALLVPEAVIGWALRQHRAAARLAGEHKADPSARIAKAEIDDRSKGDAISKGLVIVQTSWFVTQCIARGIQGLPVTELELVTVAFAALNFVIYVLWWHKPLNVQRGVRVYRKRMTGEPVDDGDVEVTVGGWAALQDTLSDLPAIVRGPYLDRDNNSGPLLVQALWWVVFGPGFALLGNDNAIDLEGKRVGTFYPAKWVAGSTSVSMFFVGIITMVFGGIHCIGWSFAFPSSIERTLWRIASLTITGAPIAFLFVGLPAKAVDQFVLRDQENQFCMKITGVSLPLLYILSRIALLVLPFLCLRSLPPAAFHVVHWASFIPHV